MLASKEKNIHMKNQKKKRRKLTNAYMAKAQVSLG
jgi:hypothetical protein